MTRKHLTSEDALQIMQEWDSKSIDDFASVFGVTPNTIRKWVSDIRRLHPEKCPRKGRRTREDMIQEAYRKLEENNQDIITDQV